MQSPVNVAKRRSSKPIASSFSMAMKVTETPSPTRVRPTKASSKLGARPNRMAPTPATSPPQNRMRRGPSVSARTPVGICITV
jgi:hypothetical protein